MAMCWQPVPLREKRKIGGVSLGRSGPDVPIQAYDAPVRPWPGESLSPRLVVVGTPSGAEVASPRSVWTGLSCTHIMQCNSQPIAEVRWR